jgi:hypothetical protein
MWLRWRAFICWTLALSTVWVFANLPRDGGSLKWFLRWAGFPWTFAFWNRGKLEWFDPMALAADIALGIAVILLVAGLCAWSRRRVSPPGSQ